MLGTAPVTRDLALLFGLVISGAAWLFTHGVVWGSVLRSRSLPPTLRWLAGLGPLLPVAAWRVGARTGALLWLVSGLLYGVLWALA